MFTCMGINLHFKNPNDVFWIGNINMMSITLCELQTPVRNFKKMYILPLKFPRNSMRLRVCNVREEWVCAQAVFINNTRTSTMIPCYETWFASSGSVHRLDGPAHVGNGSFQEWLQNNQYHRTDGPCEYMEEDLNPIGYVVRDKVSSRENARWFGLRAVLCFPLGKAGH